MPADEVPRRSRCPINFAVECFGDRWSLLIVRDLMFKGKRCYGDFLTSAEGVSTNILADRLRRLETLGIVAKVPDAAARSRSSYALTRKGLDLLPIMLELTRWSGRHDPHTNAPAGLVERIERDRDGLVADIEAGWRVAVAPADGAHDR